METLNVKGLTIDDGPPSQAEPVASESVPLNNPNSSPAGDEALGIVPKREETSPTRQVTGALTEQLRKSPSPPRSAGVVGSVTPSVAPARKAAPKVREWGCNSYFITRR
jgi:hypothetical protein